MSKDIRKNLVEAAKQRKADVSAVLSEMQGKVVLDVQAAIHNSVNETTANLEEWSSNKIGQILTSGLAEPEKSEALKIFGDVYTAWLFDAFREKVATSSEEEDIISKDYHTDDLTVWLKCHETE